MKFKFFKSVLITLSLVVMTSANAGLISNLSERDWLSVGDGLITYDRSTGLEWLDLSLTNGNSILDTEADSLYRDFRWATSAEIEMVFDYVLDGTGYRTSADLNVVNSANTFQSLFGINHNSHYTLGISRGSFLPASTKNYGLGYVYVNNNNVIINDPLNHCCWLESSSNPTVGSWLVRSAPANREQANKVPEPSTIAVLALGMIGLASRKLKKQS